MTLVFDLPFSNIGSCMEAYYTVHYIDLKKPEQSCILVCYRHMTLELSGVGSARISMKVTCHPGEEIASSFILKKVNC